MHIWLVNLHQRSPEYMMGERTVSLINGTGKTGQPHMKELNWTVIFHHRQRWTQNGLMTWNIWCEIIIWYGSWWWFFFFYLTPKAIKTEGNKWDDSKHSRGTFCTTEWKDNLPNERKYLQIITSDKELTSKIHKNSCNSIEKTKTIQLKREQQIWIDIFSKEDIQMVNRYI